MRACRGVGKIPQPSRANEPHSTRRVTAAAEQFRRPGQITSNGTAQCLRTRRLLTCASMIRVVKCPGSISAGELLVTKPTQEQFKCGRTPQWEEQKSNTCGIRIKINITTQPPQTSSKWCTADARELEGVQRGVPRGRRRDDQPSLRLPHVPLTWATRFFLTQDFNCMSPRPSRQTQPPTAAHCHSSSNPAARCGSLVVTTQPPTAAHSSSSRVSRTSHT